MRTHQFNMRLFHNNGGESISNPGTAYTEPTAFDDLRTKIAFEKLRTLNARIVVTAQGNENNDPTTKGIEIYNQTGGAQVCEVTWIPNTLQSALAGSWTSIALTADSELRIRVKASSGTEDLTVYAIDFSVEYE